MQCSKDREPAGSGFRSFFQFKYILLGIAILVSGLVWYGTRMVVAVIPENDKPPIVFSTYVGDRWNIYLTHSVERTPWEEFFRINGVNDMTMTHTRFESLGWGFPYAEYEGRLEHKNGKYILEMNRPFKHVSLRIAVQAMQHIIHGQDKYDLCTMYGTGTKLDIYAVYRYQYWLKDFPE